MRQQFLYLVQGKRSLVERFRLLEDRPQSDIVCLTYDEAIEGSKDQCIFLPNSTWSQGRNLMLERVRPRIHDYRYVVFCDDDVEFLQGDWTLFENQLLKYCPGIGVPVVHPKTKDTPVPWLPVQTFSINDEQVMAIRPDIIEDSILFPYQSQFDELHWWAACEIQEILIQTFYRPESLQLNRVVVANACRKRYEVPEAGRKVFKDEIRNWLARQLSIPIRDICHEQRQSLLRRIAKALVRQFSSRSANDQSDSEERRVALLSGVSPGSELYQQMQPSP